MLCGFEQFYQRMAGGCVAGLNNDKGSLNVLRKGVLACRQHFAALAFDPDQAAICRHGNGLRRITDNRRIRGGAIPVNPRHRKHIIKVRRYVQGDLSGAL